MLNDKIKDLYARAGFSVDAEGKWPTTLSVGVPLEKLIKQVVYECSIAASESARSHSDGDAGKGAAGAALAVVSYGESLFK